MKKLGFEITKNKLNYIQLKSVYNIFTYRFYFSSNHHIRVIYIKRDLYIEREGERDFKSYFNIKIFTKLNQFYCQHYSYNNNNSTIFSHINKDLNINICIVYIFLIFMFLFIMIKQIINIILLK